MLNNEVLPQTSMNDAITKIIIVANSKENGEMEQLYRASEWMSQEPHCQASAAFITCSLKFMQISYK